MTGKRFGYTRVSTLDQNSERQLENLELHMIFREEASGKDSDRPQLKLMRQVVGFGDTVVVHSMDRLARNLYDLLEIVNDFNKRGIGVEFIKERLVFTGNDDPMAKLLLSIMGAFAEFERTLIRERQREGIALAKQRGVYRGRTRSLSDERRAELLIRLAGGENKAKLAREFGISRETLYNYLRAASLPAAPHSTLQTTTEHS